MALNQGYSTIVILISVDVINLTIIIIFISMLHTYKIHKNTNIHKCEPYVVLWWLQIKKTIVYFKMQHATSLSQE